jgi:hypothetical protein
MPTTDNLIIPLILKSGLPKYNAVPLSALIARLTV